MARRTTKTSKGLSNPKAKVNLSITLQSKSALEKIINEVELTKSDFFEGILDGSISLANEDAKKLVNLKFDDTSSETKDDLNLTVEVVDELNKEPKDSDSNLQNNQISAQEETISTLEKKIEQIENNLQEKDQENYSLQVKLAEVSLISESFKKDLAQAKDKTEKTSQQIIDLEKSSDEKQITIDNLNQEINRLKEDATNWQNEETSSANQSAKFTQEMEKKDNLIAQLKQQNQSQNEQIRQLQTRANQITVNHNQSFANLQKTNQEQQNTITRLEKKVAELESVASIGNQTLNKWRNKMYR